MEKGIEKIREGLYVKKSFDGWRVIYPYRNDDGTLNWFNICTGGNWWKLIKVLVIILFLGIMTWSYMRDTRTCRELLNNAYEWCENYTNYIDEMKVWRNPSFPTIRLEDLNLSNSTIREVKNGGET